MQKKIKSRTQSSPITWCHVYDAHRRQCGSPRQRDDGFVRRWIVEEVFDERIDVTCDLQCCHLYLVLCKQPQQNVIFPVCLCDVHVK